MKFKPTVLRGNGSEIMAVFGITGEIEPVDDVKEIPVGSTNAFAKIPTAPILEVEDTPVNETVSSARFPHSPSFQAFAPHPVARTESAFQ